MQAPPRRGPSEASAKRTAIVRAATQLFTRHGFRKTSIDQIATQAQVAKPTIYAYFADKQALFAGVCEDVLAGVLEQARRARDDGATPVDRITGILSAKFTTAFVLLESSPYGRELLAAVEGEAARIVEDVDARYFDLLVSELRACVRSGALDLEARRLKAPEFARVLMQAAHGAGYQASSAEEQRKNLARVTELLLLKG